MYYDNQGYLIIVAGKQGTGKSESGGISLALYLTGMQLGKIHLIFDAQSFIDLINSDNLKRGDVIIWDDAGVGVPADSWFELSTKLIGRVLQPIREKNITIIFTTPSIAYIAKGIRRLFHYYLEATKIYKAERLCGLKLKEIQHNPQYDVDYYKRLKVRGPGGQLMFLNQIYLPQPPDDVVTWYKGLRHEFDEKLNKDVQSAIRHAGQKGRTKESYIESIKKMAVEAAQRTDINYTKFGTIHKDWLIAEYNLSDNWASTLKHLIEEELRKMPPKPIPPTPVEQNDKKTPPHQVTCNKCGYIWWSRTKGRHTCPNCYKSVPKRSLSVVNPTSF